MDRWRLLALKAGPRRAGDDFARLRLNVAEADFLIFLVQRSGLESEHVSYNAGYTNVHELIPWRTLSGRQQLYQDLEMILRGCA
jgi:nitrate reductase alpha subunit